MQRFLSSPRQNKRITAGNVRRIFFGRTVLFALLITFLVVLLILALLFLQANMAASELKQANATNYATLKSGIADTTKTINTGNIQNPDDRNKYLSAMTDLTTTSDQISEACATATKPLVAGMAKNYTQLSERCEEVTSSARELRDALNAFMPIAGYQGELLAALEPAVSYHRSEQKADIERGITEWRKTRESLQKVASPTGLEDNHAALIDVTAEMIAELEKARDAKTANDIAQYQSHLAALGQHYATFNTHAQPIYDSLVDAQKALTKATQSIQ